MRRPRHSRALRSSHVLCLALVLTSAVWGQESELETQPLTGLRADVAALILGAGASGGPVGDLLAGPLGAASSGPAMADDGTCGIDFRLEVAGPSLLESYLEAEDLRLELLAYVLTLSGELETTLGRRILVPAEKVDGLQSSGGIRFVGHLEVPAGGYQLRVLVRDSRTRRFALRLVGVEVPGADAEAVVETPDLRAVIVGNLDLSQESVAEQDFLGERSGKQIGAIAAGYRQVLRRLAEGKTADAVAGLRQLEGEALELDPRHSRSSQWLTAGVDRVVGEIAEHSPDSLLPILVLHTEVLTLYLEDPRADPFRIDLTLRRILEVARTIALGAGEDLPVTLSSSVLADTGVVLDQTARLQSARRMYESALELDDENPIALLNLAYLLERRGDYRGAVQLLRRLLDVDPRSSEGSLRLALSLRRLGQQRAEQEAILQRLIRESPAEWLLAIAYEELGDLLTAGERFEEARQLLENGISRLPSQQRLYVQLAYVLDRSGRKRDALEVVDRIPADLGRVSPRHLYTHRPYDGGPVRSDLLRHATARISVLAAELDRLEMEK